MADQPTVLVTGATDGLGRALAGRLAADGATLLVHGRSRERLDALVRELDAGDRVRTFLADLADLDQVRKLADGVAASTDRLDVLVDNAGVGFGAPGEGRSTSVDGHELRFAVNHLAGFLLILRLLPLLRASAPARVVRVASVGQYPIDFDDVMLEHGYDGFRAYRQAKLAQVMSTFELASRLDPAEVTVNCLHPATLMPTSMVLKAEQATVDTVDTGVESVLRLATSPELDGVTGRYYDRTREARANAQAYDTDARARLWQLSLDLTAATPP